MYRKMLILLSSLILASLVLAGCAGSGVGLEGSEVLFDVSIIEIKGATDGISPPDKHPEDLSAGYRFKPPGEYDESNPDKWQVSTYLFSPSAFTVVQGDKVTLRTFVINGDEHTVWIEKPDGSKTNETVMNRGREYSFNFTADQPGYYTLNCTEHEPTMSATILVLPAGK